MKPAIFQSHVHLPSIFFFFLKKIIIIRFVFLRVGEVEMDERWTEDKKKKKKKKKKAVLLKNSIIILKARSLLRERKRDIFKEDV
jgi:hypothetical protein